MDLLAELTSAFQLGIYVVLGFTAIGLCFAFVYYTGRFLGQPIGRKLVRLEKKGPDRAQPLLEKEENDALVLGCMFTGIVFAILVGISVSKLDNRDSATENLLKMSLRIGMREVVVMGFFRVLADLLM